MRDVRKEEHEDVMFLTLANFSPAEVFPKEEGPKCRPIWLYLASTPPSGPAHACEFRVCSTSISAQVQASSGKVIEPLLFLCCVYEPHRVHIRLKNVHRGPTPG